MRAFLLFWVLPLSTFWGWYFGARADLGYVFLSRELFDQTFAVYENILGLNADEVAMLIADAIVLDSLIILAIIAFRRRKKIASYVRSVYGRFLRAEETDGAGDRAAKRYESIASGARPFGRREPG